MRILITGGHFTPSLAVYDELLKRRHDVAYVVRRFTFEGESIETFEYRTLKREKIPFFEIRTGRLQRKFSAQTLPSLLKVPTGFWRARKILKEYKPDVVLTFGGYLAFPVALAAYIMRVPVVLHEQTQKAGLASKIISPFASRICISFESSKAFFPENKIILTGNPIRKQLIVDDGIAMRKPVIYITGGSSGSHFINQKISEILPDLLKDFVIYHQAGDNSYQDYEKLLSKKAEFPESLRERYILNRFFDADRVGSIFQKADLIVSRAGINIVCEILANGKMCLLIPFAHGQKNEQLENAKLVSNSGLGEYILENEATDVKLLTRIRYMLANSGKYLEGRDEAKKHIIQDAAKKVVKVIENVWHDKEKI